MLKFTVLEIKFMNDHDLILDMDKSKNKIDVALRANDELRAFLDGVDAVTLSESDLKIVEFVRKHLDKALGPLWYLYEEWEAKKYRNEEDEGNEL